MKCTILHESRGRLRVHVCNVRMTLHRADVLEAYLNHHDAVSKAKVYTYNDEPLVVNGDRVEPGDELADEEMIAALQELPRTAAGKLDYPALQRAIEEASA